MSFLLVYLCNELVTNRRLDHEYYNSSSSSCGNANHQFLNFNRVKGGNNSDEPNVHKQEQQFISLMNKIFPFSFIPQNSVSDSKETIIMNIQDKKALNQFIECLRDYNTCRNAIINEMLFHKIGRILKEYQFTIERNNQVNSNEFIQMEKQIHTW